MKKPEELYHELAEMMKETKDGRLHWNVEVQTTEFNPLEEKPVEKEDGIEWVVDECYVSYYCKYKGKDFCMITYEMVKTSGTRTVTTNLVFLPPIGVRVFNLHTLLPHSVPMSNVLANQIHNLWELLLQMHKADPESVFWEARPGKLTIED